MEMSPEVDLLAQAVQNPTPNDHHQGQIQTEY